jgi:signal transduction histidine kinase
MSREVAYKEFQRLYPEYLANIDKVAEIAKTSGSEAALAEFEKHNGLADDVINAIEDMASYNVDVAADLNEQADTVSLTVLFIQIAVIAVAIIVAIVIAQKTANDISKPVKFVTDFLREIGKGRTIFSETEIAEQQRISEGKDEMAECVRYLRNVTDALNGIAGLFARIVDDPAILYLPHRSPMSNAAYDKFFPGWKEYYGYNEEMDERIRLHWRGIFENADEIIEQVIKVRETHEKQELLWRFKNGTKLEFKATIVDFDDGNFGELWLARDVTAIYDLMQKANDASLAKSMFLSSMSHEIRTPMNAIIGMTSLARKTHDLDKINLYLEKTEEAGHRLMSLINDVLDMSKIESGKLQISKQEFDFAKMLDHAVSVISDKAVEKQIDVKVVYFTPITRLMWGDELRISQVIVNFLSNAVKFTPDNGKIVITTEIHKDNHLYVCCTDTGIGVSEKARKKLFHNFEQADNSITRRYGGTGLGLAISKQIVELMGGEISVESTVGKGSKFAFHIPIKLRG